MNTCRSSRKGFAGVMVIVLAVALAGVVEARRPKWGGHAAIAVSADGQTIAIGGAGRTLYIVDAATMTVSHRQWHGPRIGALTFNGDGTVLLMEDEDAAVHLLKSADYTLIRTISDADYLSPSLTADRMAVQSGRGRVVSVRSMKDGSVIKDITLPEGVTVGAHALSADGTRVAVLSKEFDLPAPAAEEAPPNLSRSMERIHQNNKGSRLIVYDVASGEILRDHTTWFTSQPDSTALAFYNDEVLVFNYSAANARIDAEGQVRELVGLPSFAYGRGLSDDHGRLVTGGLAAGALAKPMPDELMVTPFNVGNRVKGWPEYFEAFAFAPEGKGVYGVTSAFRLIHIDDNGRVTNEVPVY